MLRLGILGAGFMGGTHAAAFAKLPDVQFIGISSLVPGQAEALTGKYGGEPFNDALRLAADPRVDIVSICLPTHLHKDFAIAALQAGKHILVEKPMALSLADCDQIIEAAGQAGRLVMVAHVLRFWPEYVALAGFVKGGSLGRPLAATARRLAGPPRWSDFFLHPELSGGEILDLHIHDLDLLNWLFGTPRTVYARGQRSPETGGWDLALTLLDYGDVMGFAEGSALQIPEYPFTMGLSVLCERGSVEFSFRAGGVQVDSRDSAGTGLIVYEQGKEPCPLAFTPGDGYANEAAAFVEYVKAGGPVKLGSAEHGRLAVATALAAQRSIETGAVVAL